MRLAPLFCARLPRPARRQCSYQPAHGGASQAAVRVYSPNSFSLAICPRELRAWVLRSASLM